MFYSSIGFRCCSPNSTTPSHHFPCREQGSTGDSHQHLWFPSPLSLCRGENRAVPVYTFAMSAEGARRYNIDVDEFRRIVENRKPSEGIIGFLTARGLIQNESKRSLVLICAMASMLGVMAYQVGVLMSPAVQIQREEVKESMPPTDGSMQ